MGEIAAASGMRLTSCTETVDLSAFGISHGKCIDGERLSRIGSIPLLTRRDPNQRSGCGCDLSIDIGMYDCCGHACRYCYANHATAAIRHNLMVHDPSAPLLYGAIGEDDRIRDRDMPSFRDTQLRFL